ncbi:MAG TPA: prolipoprotein diacylglyceryl transferase family protein [Baekduia sp.]|nr:prolipoprotein diacylglyceryl transferase family protein [Baekduia sp.]
MLPEIHLFGLTLQTFGICFALGFLAAGAIIDRRLKELGHPADHATQIVGAALIGGLIGARGYWVLDNWSEAKDDLIGSIVSGAGLTWYGGAIGGAIAVLAWSWWRGWFAPGGLRMGLADLCAVPLAMGYAIGRIGCQLSGDGDYGKAWDGPWAMGYPDGKVATAPGETVHPTPIYETFTMGLLAWGLWQLRDRYRPGILFALYLIGAGIERFLVEFLRRNPDVALGLGTAQFQSLAMVAGGAIWIALAARRGPLLKTAPQVA